MRSQHEYFDRKHKKVREGWAIVRVSTAERGRTQHGSLEAQETMIRRWEKGIREETAIQYNIVRVIKEKASAKSENTHRRRDLLRLVQLIELGVIDFIVVEKLDRFSRDEIFNLELMKKIVDYNIELFFIEGGKIDFRNQGDRWRYKLDNIRAAEYSVDLSEKVTRKQRIAMVEAGKDPSPSPILGLNKHPELAGKYEIDKAELQVVIDIMTKFREFGGSREGTLNYCKENGYKSKKWWTEKKVDENGKIIKPRLIGGNPFNWATLMTLLTNPKYRGFNRFHDTFNQYLDKQDKKGFVTWEYHHHRVYGDLIDLGLLKAIDELAAKADYKSRESEFMLSGILRAPNGSRYGGEFTGKKAYYHNRKIGKRFGSQHLHKLVMDRFKEYLNDSGLLPHLIERMAAHKDFGLPKIRQQKERIQEEIKKLETATSNFSEAIRNAAVKGDSDLANVVKTLLQQKENADQELNLMKSQLLQLEEDETRFKECFRGDSLREYIKLVMEHFRSLHHLEQKRVLRTLIPQGVIRITEAENVLDLYVNLDPNIVPFPSGRGRSYSPSFETQAQIYPFPSKTKKGHFSSATPLGAGEEKWPFVSNGRRDWI